MTLSWFGAWCLGALTLGMTQTQGPDRDRCPEARGQR